MKKALGIKKSFSKVMSTFCSILCYIYIAPNTESMHIFIGYHGEQLTSKPMMFVPQFIAPQCLILIIAPLFLLFQ